MALQETKITREFVFDKQTLPDPNPKFTVEQIIDFYSNQYPELTNASYEEKREKDKITYTLTAIAGTKG